jgi:ATP-dependent Lhr-like helicase
MGTNGAIGKGRPIKALTRSTPITLMLRDHVSWLLPLEEESLETASGSSLGGNARAALEAFLGHGALFPAQLGSLLQLMPSQIEDALGELAAAGLVTSDGYPALRRLIGGKTRNNSSAGWRSRFPRSPVAGFSPSHPSSRWTLLRSKLASAVGADERTEHWCRLLLRRYGVMFRDLLANESAAPSWQALVRTYRRLEARGEIRGGRFVASVAGEQYALPEVIPMLRAALDDSDEKPLVLPATDSLNFTGRLSSGPRVPAQPGHFIVIFKGELKANEPAAIRCSH